MAKSLAKLHAHLLSTKEDIDAKIRTLEAQLGEGILTLLKQQNAFTLPYPLLCGALIEAISTIETSSDQHQKWHQQGQTFISSLKRKKRYPSKSNKSKIKTNKDANHERSST